MELFLAILQYLLLFLVLYATTKSLLHKISNLPPAPFFVLPVIGHFHLLKKPLHKHFYDLSKKYGPVFCLHFGSRLVLIVNSPSAVQDCLSKSDAIFANRPRFLAGKHFGYNYTSMAWAPYGDHWRNVRRICSIELLSSHRIQSLACIRVDDVRALVRHLFRLSCENPGTIVDMRTMTFELVFNIITRMLLGKKFYGEDGVILKEAKEFEEISEALHQVVNVSNIPDFIPWFPGSGKTERKFKAVHERRDKFLQDLVEGIRISRRGNNFSSSDVGKTVVEVLLSLQGTDPDYYTDQVIKSNIGVLFQGASDTSVATTQWAMALLLNNPAVLEKLQDEIDNHVGYERLIDDSDVAKLPYLNCIIKETLRLHPVVPLLLPHESSEETIVGGFRVPRGTMLLVNTWGVHHDPAVWEDPFMFKPERFMIEEGANDNFRYLPFGKGRRGCPGEALGMRMISLVLGTLVQCFDWERTSGELENMDETIGVVISKTQPVKAKYSPRPSMVNLLSRSFT